MTTDFMDEKMVYHSPIGPLLLTADKEGLTGVWFEKEESTADQLGEDAAIRETASEAEAKEKLSEEDVRRSILNTAAGWLDQYFEGKDPDFMPPIHLKGTSFQMEVWEILKTIPYGKTMTYGEIAQQIAKRRGIPRMAAQAVGGAVGSNPVSILVPCHRVLGSGKSLTGYGGGLDRKRALLRLEHIPFCEK